jgi:hypothetical protein
MPYQRKTRDRWDVEGNYGHGHGWECVTSEDRFRDARERIKEYRENERGVPFRLKLKRERIEAAL